MYNIEFYEDANGHSELWDFFEELRLKAATNKDARIQLKQNVMTTYAERKLIDYENLE